jgi:fumarate hydratase class II
MLPVIAFNLLQSIDLLSIAGRNLADHAIAGFRVNSDALEAPLARNPILITALNPIIGYERGSAIAKKAYAERRSILEVAAEMTDIPLEELRRLLDPLQLTKGGVGAGSDKSG